MTVSLLFPRAAPKRFDLILMSRLVSRILLAELGGANQPTQVELSLRKK